MAAFNRATHTDAKRESLHPDGRRLFSQLALTFRSELPPEIQTPRVVSNTRIHLICTQSWLQPKFTVWLKQANV